MYYKIINVEFVINEVTLNCFICVPCFENKLENFFKLRVKKYRVFNTRIKLRNY